MWATVLGFLIKSKVAKVGSGTLIGSGVISILISFIGSKEIELRNYVDLKHDVVLSDVIHLKEGQTDIKSQMKDRDERMFNLLDKIDNRLYKLLNKKRGK